VKKNRSSNIEIRVGEGTSAKIEKELALSCSKPLLIVENDRTGKKSCHIEGPAMVFSSTKYTSKGRIYATIEPHESTHSCEENSLCAKPKISTRNREALSAKKNQHILEREIVYKEIELKETRTNTRIK